MIHGLLHGRLNGGAVGGILAVPAYQTLAAEASGASSASAIGTFDVHPDGTWTSSGTGHPDKSGSWYLPTSPGTGAAYEVRYTVTKLSGADSLIANDASNWVAASAVRRLQFTIQRFTIGQTTSSYSVKVEFRIAGGGAIVSSATYQYNGSASVVDGSGGGGGGCPALSMWLGGGLLAGEVRVGQKIDGVAADAPETKARLSVLGDQVSRQLCWRLVTSNGAACVLSESTPFTLRDGSTRYAPQMLGQQVLRDDGDGGLVWDEVVICYAVGELDVIKISVGGHSLLAGESPVNRIVSHNYWKV